MRVLLGDCAIPISIHVAPGVFALLLVELAIQHRSNLPRGLNDDAFEVSETASAETHREVVHSYLLV